MNIEAVHDVHKVGGIILGAPETDQVGRLLVVRALERKYFAIPGGIREPGEKSADTLRREMLEELGLTVTGAKPYDEFSGHAPGRPYRRVRLELFLVHAYSGYPTPLSEIVELAWVNTRHLQEGIALDGLMVEHELVPRLHREGRIH